MPLELPDLESTKNEREWDEGTGSQVYTVSVSSLHNNHGDVPALFDEDKDDEDSAEEANAWGPKTDVKPPFSAFASGGVHGPHVEITLPSAKRISNVTLHRYVWTEVKNRKEDLGSGDNVPTKMLVLGTNEETHWTPLADKPHELRKRDWTVEHTNHLDNEDEWNPRVAEANQTDDFDTFYLKHKDDGWLGIHATEDRPAFYETATIARLKFVLREHENGNTYLTVRDTAGNRFKNEDVPYLAFFIGKDSLKQAIVKGGSDGTFNKSGHRGLIFGEFYGSGNTREMRLPKNNPHSEHVWDEGPQWYLGGSVEKYLNNTIKPETYDFFNSCNHSSTQTKHFVTLSPFCRLLRKTTLIDMPKDVSGIAYYDYGVNYHVIDGKLRVNSDCSGTRQQVASEMRDHVGTKYDVEEDAHMCIYGSSSDSTKVWQVVPGDEAATHVHHDFAYSMNVSTSTAYKRYRIVFPEGDENWFIHRLQLKFGSGGGGSTGSTGGDDCDSSDSDCSTDGETTDTKRTDPKTAADACESELLDKKWGDLSDACIESCKFGETSYGDLSKGCKKHYFRYLFEEYKLWILGGVGVFVLLIVFLMLRPSGATMAI